LLQTPAATAGARERRRSAIYAPLTAASTQYLAVSALPASSAAKTDATMILQEQSAEHQPAHPIIITKTSRAATRRIIRIRAQKPAMARATARIAAHLRICPRAGAVTYCASSRTIKIHAKAAQDLPAQICLPQKHAEQTDPWRDMFRFQGYAITGQPPVPATNTAMAPEYAGIAITMFLHAYIPKPAEHARKLRQVHARGSHQFHAPIPLLAHHARQEVRQAHAMAMETADYLFLFRSLRCFTPPLPA